MGFQHIKIIIEIRFLFVFQFEFFSERKCDLNGTALAFHENIDLNPECDYSNAMNVSSTERRLQARE